MKNILKLMAPIAWAFVWLFGCEIVLEYRALHRGYATLLYGDPKNAITNKNKKEVCEYGPTKQFPFRSRIYPIDNSGEHERLWIASASQANDPRISNDKLFPSVIEADLGRLGISTQVFNGSNAGDTISNSMLSIERNAGKWGIRYVIIYGMSNDIVRISNKYYGKTGRLDSEIHLSPISLNRIRWILEETTFYEYLAKNVTSRITAEMPLESKLPEGAMEEYVAEVENLIVKVKGMGFVPVICTFSMSHSEREYENMPLDYRLSMLSSNPHLAPVGWITAKNYLNERLLDIAKMHDVFLVRTDWVIDGKPEYFRDSVHFNELGHELMGQIIANKMCDIINIRKGISE